MFLIIFAAPKQANSHLKLTDIQLSGLYHGIRLDSVMNNIELNKLDIHSGRYGIITNSGGGNITIKTCKLYKNRQYGMRLQSFSGNIDIDNTQILQNAYGIALQSSTLNVDIADTEFSRNTHGLRLHNFRGTADIDSTDFLQNTKYAVSVYANNNNQQIVLALTNLRISYSSVGIQFSKYGYYRTQDGNATVHIRNNTIRDNTDAIHGNMQYNRYQGQYPVTWDIAQNDFINNTRGITLVYHNQNHIQRHSLNIQNNTFKSSKAYFMNVKGSGMITNNNFIHGACSEISQRSKLFDPLIFVNATGEHLQFAGNTVFNNSFCSIAAKIECVSKSCSVLNNTFGQNNIYGSVLGVTSNPIVKASGLIVEGNILENNKALVCETSTVYADGTRQIIIRNNIFDNPSLTYEIRNELATINETAKTDATLNYWGVITAKKISRRIWDGRQKMWTSVTEFSPFYLTKDMKKTTTDVTENNVMLKDFTLSGRLSESLSLTQQNKKYIIASDLIIPGGVSLTIMEGVILSFVPKANLVVNGQLSIRGTEVRPVTFERAEPAQNIGCKRRYLLRLTGGSGHEGILEHLLGGKWIPFCSQAWTMENTKVACRQLGFGARMY